MSINNNVPDGTFVQEIAKLVVQQPQLVEYRNGQKYHLVGDKVNIVGNELEPKPKTIQTTTLQSVVDFFKTLTPEGKMIHVAGPCVVQIIEPSVGKERQQFVYLDASADLPTLNFEQYMDTESFIIHLLSRFNHTDDRTRVQAHVGDLTAGLLSEIQDDGSTQSYSSSKGLTRAGQNIKFENPCLLEPHRTFGEVEQPISPFVLRLRQTEAVNGNPPQARIALFEADGGKWRSEAVANIGAWLRKQLPDAVILA